MLIDGAKPGLGRGLSFSSCYLKSTYGEEGFVYISHAVGIEDDFFKHSLVCYETLSG